MHGLKFRSHLRSGVSRATKARRIAELIRKTGKYRWVGIYVIENKELAAIAWTGPNAPAHPRFPIHQGLNGKAVRTSQTVNVGDVSKDPRYLTTLGTTRSEIIVPILSAAPARSSELSTSKVNGSMLS
jgi:putative methionine-R-sulfoxide reductase with GAF domain